MFRFQELTQKRQVWCGWTHTFVGGLKFEEELQLLKDSMIDSMMKELRHNETRNMAESEKLLKAVQAIEVGKLCWEINSWLMHCWKKLQVAICLKLLAGLTKGGMLLVEPPCYKTSRRRSRIKSNERSQEIWLSSSGWIETAVDVRPGSTPGESGSNCGAEDGWGYDSHSFVNYRWILGQVWRRQFWSNCFLEQLRED